MHLPLRVRRRIFGVTAAAIIVSGVGLAARPAALPTAAPDNAAQEPTNTSAAPLAAPMVLESAKAPTAVGAEAALLAAFPDAVPAVSAEAAPEPAAEEVPKPKVTTYTVVEGDTIEGIAARFGLSTETLLYVNDLYADEILQIGQELQIPAMDALVYTVAEGDTLWGVADAFAAEFDAIVEANPDVNAEALQPGEVLLVPGGTPPSRRTMVASRGGERSASPSGTLSYWPVSGPITEWYGWRSESVSGTSDWHDGMDISVDVGTPIAAAASGTVTYAGWLGGYGIVVKLDHGDGTGTMYAHLSEAAVGPGDWVEAGGLVGYSGNTGVSTGPHLHFMVFVGGTPVDPSGWLP